MRNFLVGALSLATFALAASGDPSRSRVDSGPRVNESDAYRVTFTEEITTPVDRGWTRLEFSAVTLGEGSFLRVTSLLDGESQRLDRKALERWRGRSAFFNGPKVLLELVAAPGTTNRVSAAAVDPARAVAATLDPQQRSICSAADDRQPPAPHDPARSWSARLLLEPATGGCSASISSLRVIPGYRALLSAGHCFLGLDDSQTPTHPGPRVDVAQFNVPLSAPDCTLSMPSVSDQYAIAPNVAMVNRPGISAADGPPDDWAVFRVRANESSGLSAFESQGAAVELAPAAPGAGEVVRALGYGRDGNGLDVSGGGPDSSACQCLQQDGNGTRNQTLQVASGVVVEPPSPDVLRFEASVCAANSGGAVVTGVVPSQRIVGVVRGEGDGLPCTQEEGYNDGTSVLYPPFLDAAITALRSKLVGEGVMRGDRGGLAVSSSGELIAVGAPGASSSRGKVWAFRREGWIYEQTEALEAPGGSPGDLFGWSLGLSGSWLVVGAEAAGTGGLAYVFEHLGDGEWSDAPQVLEAGSPQAGDRFGSEVSIDGDRLVVGAPGDDEVFVNAGAIYVYENVGGTWQLEDRLTAADPSQSANFGESVGISGDTLVTGAQGDDQAGMDAGATYVFERAAGTWAQVEKIVPLGLAAGDKAGEAVAISGDTLVFGARTSGSGTGVAYVYRRDGLGWGFEQQLTPTASQELFGDEVAIRGDRIVVGALYAEARAEIDSGVVYLFERTGSTWDRVDRLHAPDAWKLDELGRSVALTEEGIPLVGAPENGLGGAAYVFLPNTDLEVVAPAPDPVAAGRDATLVLELENHGPSDSTGGDLSLVLPPELGFVGASPPGACSTAGGGTVSCASPALAAGGMAQVSLTLSTAEAGDFAIAYRLLANEGDSFPNDAGEVTLQVNAPGSLFADGFESGNTAAWSATVP